MNTFDQQQYDLFVYDYYRMTGEKYKSEPKCLIKKLLFHNLKFMFWYRRFQKYHGLIAKGMLYRLSRKYGLEISPKAQVGKGLYLGHPYNITIGESVVIGNNVNIHKGCTIGRTNRGEIGSPHISDNVYIGINATVVGNIYIGNDVLIAPNSYVNMDIPDHSIVIGNPGIIHHSNSAIEGYVNFMV